VKQEVRKQREEERRRRLQKEGRGKEGQKTDTAGFRDQVSGIREIPSLSG
jgi:hypothetical protein